MSVSAISSEELQNFFQSLIKAAEERWADELVSIVLFGSAATDEWVKGKSDVDFIVVIRNREKRKAVEDYLNQKLLELDKRLGLGFAVTCSSYRKRANPFLRLVDRVEDWFTFGRPFYILSLDQIDFERSRINDFRIRVMSIMFDSPMIIAQKIKRTGITIYGENVIAQLSGVPTRGDKVRAAMAPLWILLIAATTWPFDRRFSLQHAVKATVWASEDALFAMDQQLSSTGDEFQLLRTLFQGRDFGHLEKTIYFKRKWSGIIRTISRKTVLVYIVSSLRFILALYFATVRRSHRYS